MRTMETVEPGIYRRIDTRSGKVLPKLWIHYPGPRGKTEPEPTHTTSIVQARKLRAKRMEEAGRGEPGRAAQKVRVDELLEALVTNYQLNGRHSLRTLASHLKVLRPAFGHYLRAGGMDESDAMKVTGHQTAHVFRHYDLGDVDALRARLSAARARAARVRPLREAAGSR